MAHDEPGIIISFRINNGKKYHSSKKIISPQR